MFGHWFEILAVLFVGLLVFGPKRMIEMGSQLGKLVRELRESTRDMNFSALLSTDESAKQPTHTYQAPSVPTAGSATEFDTMRPDDVTTVEGGVERVEHAEDIVN